MQKNPSLGLPFLEREQGHSLAEVRNNILKNLDPELYKKTKVESLFFNGHNRQEDGEPAIDFFYRGYVDAIPLPKHLAYVEIQKLSHHLQDTTPHLSRALLQACAELKYNAAIET